MYVSTPNNPPTQILVQCVCLVYVGACCYSTKPNRKCERDMGLPKLPGIDLAARIEEFLQLLRDINHKLDILIEQGRDK
jgi:hypothetical protein